MWKPVPGSSEDPVSREIGRSVFAYKRGARPAFEALALNRECDPDRQAPSSRPQTPDAFGHWPCRDHLQGAWASRCLVDSHRVSAQNLHDHHEVPLIATTKGAFGYFGEDQAAWRMLINGLQLHCCSRPGRSPATVLKPVPSSTRIDPARRTHDQALLRAVNLWRQARCWVPGADPWRDLHKLRASAEITGLGPLEERPSGSPAGH